MRAQEINGVPDSVVEQYSYGDCMWLALAMNARFGWPIYAQMHRDAEHGDYVAHAYCKMPDGREIDILGPPDRVDIWTNDTQQWDPAELLKTMETRPAQIAHKLAEANAAVEHYIVPKLKGD